MSCRLSAGTNWHLLLPAVLKGLLQRGIIQTHSITEATCQRGAAGCFRRPGQHLCVLFPHAPGSTCLKGP